MRYLPTASAEDRALLDAIGVDRAEDLLTGVPDHLKMHRALDLTPTSSELEVLREMERLAGLNTRFATSFASKSITIPSVNLCHYGQIQPKGKAIHFF